MNEKVAVSDLLSCENAGITAITHAIEECDSENLKQIFIDARSKLETLKCDTYLIAKEKGYYIPAAPAGEADIQQVKNAISQ